MKTKRFSFLRSLLPVLFAGLAISCSDEECDGNRNSLPLADFFRSGAGRVSLESLTIYGDGAPGDSLLSDGKTTINQVYLPFNLDSDESQFVVTDDTSGVSDRITFRYDKHPRFESAACGVIYIFDIREIETTHNLIDSVTCPAMRIDNTPGANIHIYFRPGVGEKEEEA